MRSKKPLDFELDLDFSAYRNSSYAVEQDRIVEVKTTDWCEIRSIARDIILVASIVGISVFGIAAIYEHSGRTQAITCQEGC